VVAFGAPCAALSAPPSNATSGEELREIDAAAASIKLQGARYPENLSRMVGR